MIRSFEFTAGAASLDLIDTVASRETSPCDLLHAPEDLDRWLQLAGFDHQPVASATKHQLHRARALREAVYRAAEAVTENKAPAQADIETLNAFAKKPSPSPRWTKGQVTFTAPAFFDAAFSLLAADAIHRLSDAQRARLRRCPDCRMLFFDNSRPGKRVWCSSTSGCGNRAKVRRHRARKA